MSYKKQSYEINASSPTRALQPSRSIISSDFDPLQHDTITNSTINQSPNGKPLSPLKGYLISPPCNTHLPMLSRAKTEANDNSRTDFLSWRIQTDPNDLDDHDHIRNGEGESGRKTAAPKSFRKISDVKRSQSVQRLSKGSSPVSKTSKQVIAEKHNMFGLKKRPQSSAERVNHSIGGESTYKLDKKTLKTAIQDLELDLGINEKCNTEGDAPESLFGGGTSERDLLNRDVGPIRYSKMSEEDAATMFETRRKELLSFLVKLGANSAMVKKKMGYKNPGLPKPGMIASQHQENGKHDFLRERGPKKLQDTTNKDAAFQNRFIIYNTGADTVWSNNGRLGTPAHEGNKKVSVGARFGCESAPLEERRNSNKMGPREKEEVDPCVERNLEASFNQIAIDWTEASEKKSPRKTKKTTENVHKACEDKIETAENVTIDLTKVKVTKKKKAKKAKNDEEKAIVLEMPHKQSVEEFNASPLWENTEVRGEGKISVQVAERMKKKNQFILNEIEEIDSQIRRLEGVDKGFLKNKRVTEEKVAQKKKEEAPNMIFMENLQEGYAHAAKLKKAAERPRSMSLKSSLVEGPKQFDISRENSSKILGGQKNGQISKEKDLVEMNRHDSTKLHRFTPQLVSKDRKDMLLDRKDFLLAQTPSLTNLRKAELEKEREVSEKKKPIQVQNVANASNKAIAVNRKAGSQEPNSNSRLVARTNNNTSTSQLKLRTLDLMSESSIADQPFFRGVQTTVNHDKNKLSKSFGRTEIARKQQSNQQSKSRDIKTPASLSSISTLQSVRDVSLISMCSPKEATVVPTRKSTEGPKPGVFKKKRQLSNSSANNTTKLMLNYKRPGSKISLTKSQKSLLDGECKTEGNNDLPDLFESQISSNNQDGASLPSKLSFSDEIKKILKEASDKEKETLTLLKPKQVNNKENRTSSQQKKITSNRPDLNSLTKVDIRTKVFKEARPNQENGTFVKLELSTNSLIDTTKHDLRHKTIHDNIPSTTKAVPSQQNKKGEILRRKGSLSTPRAFFKGVISPINKDMGSNLSGLELEDEAAMLRASADMLTYQKAGEGLGLKERCLNVYEQTGKPTKQVDIAKNSLKDASNTLKKKKMAGYSVC